MGTLVALSLVGCAKTEEPQPQPVLPDLPLTALMLADSPDCAFVERVDGPMLLAVDQRRDRAVGQLQPAGGDVREIVGTAAGSREQLVGGVQLEGAGLTASVHVADLPGVPEGAGGVRRAGILTVADVDGASRRVEGVWSCRRPA